MVVGVTLVFLTNVPEIEIRVMTTSRDLFSATKELKRDYQPRSNLVKDENVDCLQISTIF
jgi:hypothetical protein